MQFCDNSMKGEFVAVLDKAGTGIDNLALAVSTNNFLETPVTYDEAFAIYTTLLGMCDEEHELVDEPIRSKLLHDVRMVSPILIAQKIRSQTRSIRTLFADSIAFSLCRQQEDMLENLSNTIYSNSAADILALVDDTAVAATAKK
jgi:hypothetical protein